ncbi:MAG: hypothetical protein QNK05_11455 [Myxococcota bacterium]|nr:hypothetical protein [Myxococcota bacterium]
MSLQDLGSLGELVGGLAVIISIAYLAVQIRQNTTSVRGATYASIVESVSQFNRAVASDEELARIYEATVEDFDSVRDLDRVRTSQMLFSLFRQFENIFYQHRRGLIDPVLWPGWRRIMLLYHARPGVQKWWSYRRNSFSDEFCEFLEHETLDRELPTVKEMVSRDGPAGPDGS